MAPRSTAGFSTGTASSGPGRTGNPANRDAQPRRRGPYHARVEELSNRSRPIRKPPNKPSAQLGATTVESLNKSTAASVAATEALNRSAAKQRCRSIAAPARALTSIGQSAAAANETIGKTAADTTQLIARSAAASATRLVKRRQGRQRTDRHRRSSARRRGRLGHDRTQRRRSRTQAERSPHRDAKCVRPRPAQSRKTPV